MIKFLFNNNDNISNIITIYNYQMVNGIKYID